MTRFIKLFTNIINMSSRDKFETFKNVFDNKTLLTLFKLSSDGYFEELKSPISIGKESNVFNAVKKDGSLVCVKIYRVNACDFRKMYQYIAHDPRFSGLQKKRRQIIKAWAQREYRNLLVAREAGADVPTPYAVRDNVLVLEFIGDKEAAPKLKDKEPEDYKKFSNQIIKNIKILYKKGFVNGDLSEYNILNYKDKAILIDLSHGVKLESPNSQELLERDIKNVERYFLKRKIKMDVQKILKEMKK